MIVSHGNAVGLYFRDPEGNRCEVYWPTGLKARQPYLEMVDLDEDVDEILRKIKESVAEHGESGVVDMRALEKQNIAAQP
jgi:catechol-2,3-dioxygenase